MSTNFLRLRLEFEIMCAILCAEGDDTMNYDKALIAGKLRRWEKYLNSYRLPAWEDIPDFGLYMEQVIVLLQEYLDYLPPELKEEQFITAATINNYVRKKIMPMPERKKYYRVHIAYLIMICSLKQCLSISTLQTVIPMGLTADEVRETYTGYVRRHRDACVFFSKTIRILAGGILDHERESDFSTDSTEDLVMYSAISSGLARLLAEKLLLLNGKTLSDGGAVEDKGAREQQV